VVAGTASVLGGTCPSTLVGVLAAGSVFTMQEPLLQ
jgi:hypothetical protein